MMHFLVPTDFSPAACHALAVAVQLARPLGGRITLLHAVELPPADDLSPDVFVMKLLQAAKHQLQLLLREATPYATEAIIQELLQVAPRRTALLAALTQQRPNMVVIGSAAAPASGSTTEWLVRTALCPVLVVRQPLSDSPVRTVVFATDFSVLALRAGPVLRQLQTLFPAAVLHVLHVGAVGQLAETLLSQLTQLVQQHGLADSELAIVTAPSLHVGIAQFAQQVQADMVVLRAGAAGIGWLWPTDEASAQALPALPPVLTFRLAEETGVEDKR